MRPKRVHAAAECARPEAKKHREDGFRFVDPDGSSDADTGPERVAGRPSAGLGSRGDD